MCLNFGIERLIKRLGNRKNFEIRQQTIQDLVKIGGLALDQLIDALNHKNHHIRQGVAEVLGMIGNKRAEEPLIEVLKSEKDKNVRDQMKLSLHKIIERKQETC